jgi:molybdopterin-biosynthesis enzyme MoeA-like protein
MAHPMARWVLEMHFPAVGDPERQRAVRVFGITESGLTDLMEDLVERFPEVKLFSLPRLGEEFQIELGFRGTGDLDAPFAALVAGLESRKVRFVESTD